MNLVLTSIRPAHDKAIDALLVNYIKRTSRYAPAETLQHRSEDAFLTWLTRQRAASPTFATLLDARGKLLSSEAFANSIAGIRGSGKRTLVLAIGPADGWSRPALDAADSLLSLGPMTLAHQIARLVLAEQVYRAFTILANHPYHSGH